MTLEDYAADFEAEVWPDNVAAVGVFVDIGTQWRVGPAGLLGLDYNVLPMALELAGIARNDWPDTFQAIRIMEAAALAEIRRQQEAAAESRRR